LLDEDDDNSILRWFSPWGFASLCLVSLSLFQAYTVGMQSLTVILSFVGLAVTYIGFRSTREARRNADWVWLSVGGILNCIVGVLTLFAPGTLNTWWALNEEMVVRDPEEKFVVPRDNSSAAGRTLNPDEWADAATEAIRQEQMLIRIESVKMGSSAGKGSNLLIHLRLVNMGHGDAIPFETFAGGKHDVVLKDDSGQTFTLQEHRVRKPSRGAPVFESFTAGQTELPMGTPIDQLLVFAVPTAKINGLHLEIPSSAWGMKGMCRFRIAGSFEAAITDKKK
jgi:hypothetical protein